jgi:hypothetical protein
MIIKSIFLMIYGEAFHLFSGYCFTTLQKRQFWLKRVFLNISFHYYVLNESLKDHTIASDESQPLSFSFWNV